MGSGSLLRERSRFWSAASHAAVLAALWWALTGGAAGSWVSAVDVASLMALLLTLSAEVIALVLGLWLLARTSRSAVDAPAPAEA